MWLKYLSHPALSKRFKKETRMFVVPDLEDRSVQVGVEVIRRESRRLLENKEVMHFEVVSFRQDDCRSEPHTVCAENGCDGCRGLGVVFVADRGKHVDLMGWVAVVRVA